MTMLEAFNMMDQFNSFTEGTWDPESHEPQYHETHPQSSMSMQDCFNMYRTDHMPSVSAFAGYISPYPTNNWDTSSGILDLIEDSSRLPSIAPKLDPNKIFSSDVAALRALASDQNKITKMFEKRLVESLADKGKFGLTEDDVEAMQALTSARSAILSIQNAQINIKKNIADLKIKQQQQQNANGVPGIGGGSGMNSMDVGKSFMDKIFDVPSQPPIDVNYVTNDVGLEQASQVIDDLIPNVGTNTIYESSNPTTYVVVGESDDDVDFETYTADGRLIPDYPNPTTHIESIDREAKKATDDLMVEYPVKFR